MTNIQGALKYPGVRQNTRAACSWASPLQWLIVSATLLVGLSRDARAGDAQVRILGIQGRGEVSRAGTQVWAVAATNQVLLAQDRLRTMERSRVTLLWSDQSTIRLGELSEIEIQPAPTPKTLPGFNLMRGLLYFFHRDKPADVRFRTRVASAAVRGTEFNLEVQEDGRTILTVLEGIVEFSNDQGPIILKTGEQGVAGPNGLPLKTPAISAINVIQWALYYPAILDLGELPLTDAEQQALRDSLQAYRTGDVLSALGNYPAERQPASAAEKVYFAGLLLAVGKLDATEELLNSLAPAEVETDRASVLAAALRRVIAAVKLQSAPSALTAEPGARLASEWLAESYYQQSQAHLSEALEAARKAIEKSPNFGFGWARVAELEFSFGRTSKALTALEKGLKLAPRNAEALALKGFLLTAQNKVSEAIVWFDRAIAVDSALGNGWLGRGLCLIRKGKILEGRQDLLVAATVEPQRALFRSYLAKAYSNEGDTGRARKEIQLAERLDSKDPTPWLYSALLNRQNNRINEAVRDLEKSQELNDNRRVYRSRLLLDQDRAVRSANLANIYRDAGMLDVSLREAARAVNADYANYSAHLFLANSYDQFRDPKFINLRFETAANTEYLIANLLAPVGGGTLNSAISQQEYSRLFERDRLGVVSSTEYFSGGDWVQSGAQYGTLGNMSYSLGAFYRTENGQRPNNDLEQRQLVFQLKQQLTPKDNVYFEASHLEIEGGDLAQYYDHSSPFPNLRTRERQEPILTLGYHHEWNPSHRTLVLASWLNDDLMYGNPSHPALLAIKAGPAFRSVAGLSMETDYRGRIEVYSVEPQHIWQQENHLSIFGARFQIGDVETRNLQTNPSDSETFFLNPPALQNFTTDFERWTAYGYHHWQLFKSVRLSGGLVYDRLVFPENFLAPPVSDKQSTEDQLSPKAGLIWTPSTKSTVRFAYSRSLSGAGSEQSVRIEPTQVAGFNQAFRSLIPESVAGSIPAAEAESYGLSLEQKVGSGTYLGLTGEILNSDVERTVGAFIGSPPPPPPRPRPGEPAPPPAPPPAASASGLRQSLDYQEQSLGFTVHQLIADEWSVGARYRLARAELTTDVFEIADSVPRRSFEPRQTLESTLHQVNLFCAFNHSSGFFSQFEALWYSQNNQGYLLPHQGNDFWHLHLFAGYRFHRRNAELRVGLLNITDQDYQLNPLTVYADLPRERTLTVRFQFNF